MKIEILDEKINSLVGEAETLGNSGEVEEAVLEPPPTPPKQMLPTDHPRGTQARILTAGADLEWVSESGFEVRGVAKQ